VKRVLAPSRNEGDLEDIPAPLREGMDFVWVDEIGDVFDAALRNGRRGYARRS
jgi:ATP-dependent Lon protease